MNRLEFGVLALIMVLGVSLGGAISEAWDAWLWSRNIDPVSKVLNVEKYGIQVIEATIWAWGIAIMVVMGMLAWWLNWTRK